MGLYIHSSDAISSLPLFRAEKLIPALDGEDLVPRQAWFSCRHPEYKQYIAPAALRRMSPVIRMGLAAAKSCLERAGLERPDSILVGSGLGCVRDTVKFLDQVIAQDEQLLNPTAFIQSTHNTVSGQIALATSCHGSNLTYSQKGLSFESALLDAMMLSAENAGSAILLGGVDEMVEESYTLMEKAGCVRDARAGNILECREAGAVAGEGAAFFVVNGNPGTTGTSAKDSPVCIRDLWMQSGNPGTEGLAGALDGFLERNGLQAKDIDLVVSGRDGDARTVDSYRLMEQHFPDAAGMAFKHLAGHYDTSSSMAVFLAARILETGELPDAFLLESRVGSSMKNALLLNLQDRDVSFILLSRP